MDVALPDGNLAKKRTVDTVVRRVTPEADTTINGGLERAMKYMESPECYDVSSGNKYIFLRQSSDLPSKKPSVKTRIVEGNVEPRTEMF